MMKKVLLIGAGDMAQSYYDVLKSLEIHVDVVCRSKESADEFEKRKGVRPCTGGMTTFLESNQVPDCCVVAVEVENLAQVTLELISAGAASILVEKPGGLFYSDFIKIDDLARDAGCKVFVAYNRRFYDSVTKLREISDADEGIRFLSFDFTEWSDSIAPLKKGPNVKERWVLGNSTHVIDLAIFLGGKPSVWESFVAGGLDWHKAGEQFAGGGITDQGVMFNYRADWDAPGRWGLVAYTQNYKLELLPLESLLVTNRNSVNAKESELLGTNDVDFKPGLRRQVEAYLSKNYNDLCSISEQCSNYEIYKRIAGYKL